MPQTETALGLNEIPELGASVMMHCASELGEMPDRASGTSRAINGVLADAPNKIKNVDARIVCQGRLAYPDGLYARVGSAADGTTRLLVFTGEGTLSEGDEPYRLAQVRDGTWR